MPNGQNPSTVVRDLAIVCCAASAGIHAALTPEHFHEGAGAGGGFLAATILLAGLAVALTRRDLSGGVLLLAAATLAGLIGSYGLTVTTGLPLLHPEIEPIEPLAAVTKAIEAIGLLASLRMLPRLADIPNPLEAKGTVT